MSGFADIGTLPDPELWRGATVLARDAEGRVLMQLRDSHAHVPAAGKWCFFGGAVEPGEALEAAARREFQEETGIDLSGVRLSPMARFASEVLAGGAVYVFTLDRAIAPQEISVNEGAGFAFLTRAQIAAFDLIGNFRRCVLTLEDF